MTCNNCERLNREIRELREELAEWGRVEKNETLADKLRKRFRLRPQASHVLAELVTRPDRVFGRDAMIQHMGYTGSPMETVRDGEDQAIRNAITWIRNALKDERLDVTIRNIYGAGYLVSKADAAVIRAAV